MFSGSPSVPSSLVEASAWNPIEVPGRGSRKGIDRLNGLVGRSVSLTSVANLLDADRSVYMHGLRLPCIYSLHVGGQCGKTVRELLLC